MEEWDELHALFDTAPDTILVADDDRRYVYANRAAEELLGVRVEEILRLRVEDISDAEPGVVRELWASFLEQGSLRGEFVVRRPDGTRRKTDFHARANFRPGLHCPILRELAPRASEQGEHAPSPGRPPADVEALEHVLEAACAELGWDAANLWLPVKRGAPLVWLAGVPSSLLPASRGLSFDVSDGMVGRVWMTGRPEWIEDVAREPAFLRTEAFTRAGLRTVVGIPLEEGKRTVAVLDVASKRRIPRDGRRLEQLARLAPILAATITARWPVHPRPEPPRRRPAEGGSDGGTGDRRAELLTPREREILGLVADGHTSQEIADQLGITRRTVDTHRTNINRKLGLRSVASLTRFALEHGLVSGRR